MRPIRLRHEPLPLIAMPRGGGFVLGLAISEGYNPASVHHWMFDLAAKHGQPPRARFWTDDVTPSGQTITLSYPLDTLSEEDDSEVTIDTVSAQGLCEWGLTAYNEGNEILWRAQGDVDFDAPRGGLEGTSAGIGSPITISLGSETTFTITILGNAEAGSLDAAGLAALIHGATEKETIADADEIGGPDSAATYGLKRWKWSTVKTWVNGLISTAITALNLGNAASKNVGTSAGSVAAGDDARLSDARTPTAHQASHAIGGDDTLSPADIGAATALQGAAADAAKAITDLITVTEATNLDTIRTKVAGLDSAIVLQGTWDASAGTFPGGGAAQAGNTWRVSVDGTVGGVAFKSGDRVMAIVDNASTTTFAGNWFHEDYTDRVESVAGLVGSITASALRAAMGIATTDAPTFAGLIAPYLSSTAGASQVWRTGPGSDPYVWHVMLNGTPLLNLNNAGLCQAQAFGLQGQTIASGAYGNLLLAAEKLKAVRRTLSAIGTADAAGDGVICNISDGATTTLGGVATDGGSLKQAVMSDGTDWIVIGGPTPSGGGGSVSNPNVAYVRSDGDDGTAEIGDPAKPYETAQAAWNAGARRFDLGVGSFSISHESDYTIATDEYIYVRGWGASATSLSLSWDGLDGVIDNSSGKRASNLNLYSDKSVSISISITGGDAFAGGNGSGGDVASHYIYDCFVSGLAVAPGNGDGTGYPGGSAAGSYAEFSRIDSGSVSTRMGVIEAGSFYTS